MSINNRRINRVVLFLTRLSKLHGDEQMFTGDNIALSLNFPNTILIANDPPLWDYGFCLLTIVERFENLTANQPGK